MSLALGLVNPWLLGGLSETVTGSLESFVTFSGCLQDSFNADTALFRMIHCLFTTCSCVGTSGTVVCVTKWLKVSFAQLRSFALAEIRAPVEVEELPHVAATQAL